MSDLHDRLPGDWHGLSSAVDSGLVDLADGEVFRLVIAPVVKQLGDDQVRMLAYNGSIPGPTLRVGQGTEVVVEVANWGDLETTVHWHGLRLDNRYDGTPENQQPIPVGGTFTYVLQFPDPGIYWYHPHVREDYGQEMGLYGNIIVSPQDADYWPRAHREIAVVLDDVLIEDGSVASFSRSHPTHVAMGRFGNVLLANGDPNLTVDADCGEVVRFYLTNTANTRVFNVALPGARMKVVGGDSGRVEREAMVESVILGPSERTVVDVHLTDPGTLTLEHRTPDRTYRLATVNVAGDDTATDLSQEFNVLRNNPEWATERTRFEPYLHAAPEKTLAFIAVIEVDTPEGAAVYSCPMHPEVVSDRPGTCPKCGMKLIPATAGETPDPDTDEAASHRGHSDRPDPLQSGHGHGEGSHQPLPDDGERPSTWGIEWEDDMAAFNRSTTPAEVRWQLVDRHTGKINHEIDWQFRVGDLVKLRLVNEVESDHPMHHPFHIHGAGRFVVIQRDGVEEKNLAWKDTVLVRTGETVDLLFDVTNSGRWMAHCHIAEHHEGGMMFTFDVLERETVE